MDDLLIARKYISKVDHAKEKGIHFDLSITSFANMMKAKRCGLTGIKLDSYNITVDRIDNDEGYISGNVMAVCTQANQLKSIWENPSSQLTQKNVLKMMKKLEKINV